MLNYYIDHSAGDPPMRIFQIILFIFTVISGIGMAAVGREYIQNEIAELIIFIVFALTLLGQAIVGYYNVRKNPWKDFSLKSRNAEEVMGQALDLACLTMSEGQHTFRANIFMKCDRDETKICVKYYSTNMVGDSDLGMKLEKWQGCAGQAWGYDAPTVANLKLPEIQGGSSWGLDLKQLEMTRDLAAVLSVPVRHPENNLLIAILNFDTKEPIADLLTHDRHKAIALQVAQQVGLLIFGFGDFSPLL